MLPEWAAHFPTAQQICSADFPYLQPWFYNHPYALRCELAVGESRREQLDSAAERAWNIFETLFEDGVDAVFFDHWLTDATLGDQIDIRSLFCALRSTVHRLGILRRWMKYPFHIVRGLDNGEEDVSLLEHRSRIIYFVRGQKIDFRKIVEKQSRTEQSADTPLSFVSFENECILSIYSHLGCDIVFSSKEKMQQFFPLLKPYLYDYDMEEMLLRVGCEAAAAAELPDESAVF